MKRALLLLLPLLVVSACSDTPTNPLEPADGPGLTVAAQSADGLKAHKSVICHVDAQGRYRPITVARAALPAQMALGSNPLIGYWSGRWYWDFPNGSGSIGLEVWFRDDCGGFEEGAFVADVQYHSPALPYPYTWTFVGIVPGGFEVVEVQYNGTPVVLTLTFDPETGEMRIDVPPPWGNQWGVVTQVGE